jgi:hypothetical protein
MKHLSLSFFLVAFLLIGCGGSDNEQSVPTPDQVEDAEAVESSGESIQTEDQTNEIPEEKEASEEEKSLDEEVIEERIASDVGVTEDTITIAVVIADLKGLRDIGYPLPDGLTNEALSGRIATYLEDWNAQGGINGRTFEMVEITWNPLDPVTMENVCTEATLDNEVFIVVNSSGFDPAYLPCLTEDNDTTVILGDKAPQYMFDSAPDRLFGFYPPGEIAAVQAGRIFLAETDLPAGSKIGILESNNPAPQAASAEVKEMLENNGFETATITINTQSGDNAASNAEAAAAVSQFNAEGVSEVFVLLGFLQTDGFWGEVQALNVSWGRTLVDVAPGMCTQFGASRTNPAAEGASCVTASDSYSLPNGELRQDRPFETQCREEWLDHFPVFEGRSDIGVPSGEVNLETVDGELLNSDFAGPDCTIVYALKYAFENAGVNPTRDSFAAALKTYSGPAAQISKGEGAFEEDKNFFSTSMWQVEFRIVPADTPRGSDGKFNGCPAPTNCWVPVSGQWFSIE